MINLQDLIADPQFPALSWTITSKCEEYKKLYWSGLNFSGFQKILFGRSFLFLSKSTNENVRHAFCHRVASSHSVSKPNSIFIGGLRQEKKIFYKIKKLQIRKNSNRISITQQSSSSQLKSVKVWKSQSCVLPQCEPRAALWSNPNSFFTLWQLLAGKRMLE